MWEDGEYIGYKWDAKVFDSPSPYGINGGRISKLTITDADDNEVLNYNRGWVHVRKGRGVRTVLNMLLEKFA